jgi:hypothetical protein
MRKLFVLFLVLAAAVMIIPASAVDHTIQWQNHCSYPVWVAIQGGEQYTVKGIVDKTHNPKGDNTTYGGCSCMLDGSLTTPIGCNPTTKCDGLACPGPKGEGNYFRCNASTAKPLVDGGGFRLDADNHMAGPVTTHVSTLPMFWQGAFWPRTGCTGSDDDLNCDWMTCRVVDDGKGKTRCGGQGVTPPATKGEINFDQNGADTYDVSIVDGFNVPIEIELVPGTGKKVPLDAKHAMFDCGISGTQTELLPLFNATNLSFTRLVKTTEAGKMAAIWSACSAASPPNPQDPRWQEYCCKGKYGSAQDYAINGNTKCDPSTWPRDLDTASFFHKYLIGSYSYAYDDDASTFQCRNADTDTVTSYLVTFCGANEPDRISLPGSEGHTHVPVFNPGPVVTPAPTQVPVVTQTAVPTTRYNPASFAGAQF